MLGVNFKKQISTLAVFPDVMVPAPPVFVTNYGTSAGKGTVVNIGSPAARAGRRLRAAPGAAAR